MCESEVCFMHIQLIGTVAWLPKIHNVPPDVVFESSRSPTKSVTWSNPSMHRCAVFPTNNFAGVHLYDECTRSKAPIVCHKISSTLWPHEQVCSQTTKYQVSQYEPNTDSCSSSLNWWSSMHGVATLYNCWVVIFASSQYLATHFFASPSMSYNQEDIVSASGFPGALVGSFSLASAEILDSNISL